MPAAGRRGRDRIAILSGAHNAIVPRVMELLKQNEMTDVMVLIGGIIPDQDVGSLKEHGVAAVFQRARRWKTSSASFARMCGRAAWWRKHTSGLRPLIGFSVRLDDSALFRFAFFARRSGRQHRRRGRVRRGIRNLWLIPTRLRRQSTSCRPRFRAVIPDLKKTCGRWRTWSRRFATRSSRFAEGGGAKAIEAQHSKQRLTARERIALLATIRGTELVRTGLLRRLGDV